MQTSIRQWVNSVARRIPKAFVKEAHVAYGTAVAPSIDDGKIINGPEPVPEAG